MYRTTSEWAKLAWDPSEWMRLGWDPFEWMKMGADLMSFGVTTGSRLYGRRAEIEELETFKKGLQDEIADVDKRLEVLKAGGAHKN